MTLNASINKKRCQGPPPKPLKIALVHDFLTCFGGAEQVLMSLHNIYPQAPIYTLLYDKEKMRKYFPNAKIRPSFLNKLPKFMRKRKKYLLPFFPTAAETFDLRDFDLVISSSNSFVKGIITKPKTVHICYCHAPARFLWDWHFNYLNENRIKGIKKMFLLPLLHYLRMWDKSASDRVDYFLANSKNTANKIKKFYGRESEVIYPPSTSPSPPLSGRGIKKAPLIREVGGLAIRGFHSPNEAERSEAVEPRMQDLHMRFHSSKETIEPSDYGKYFLVVSRLSAYKKIDIAIEAFNKLGFTLIVIGEGEEKNRLKKMAEKNIKFLGFQPRETLEKYYQYCQALIFPGEEDFGITIVEAMSFGKPVLAYRKGGALETMIEGIIGEFFDDPIAEILADGVRRLKNNFKNYDAEKIKKHAEKFSRDRFENDIRGFTERIIRQGNK